MRYAILALTILLIGCGGHGSSPSSNPGPVISNLRATLATVACTLQGLPGTVVTATVSFRDSDGDLDGGTVQATGTFDTGSSFEVTSALPGPGTRLDGTTRGTVEANYCVRFGAFARVLRLAIALVDRAGHASNVLSAEVRSPGRALTPKGLESGAPLIEPAR